MKSGQKKLDAKVRMQRTGKLLGKIGQSLSAVTDVKRELYNLSERPKDGDGALSAGNINTCCVHVQTPVDKICNGRCHLTHCRFHLFDDANAQVLPAQIEYCECEDG